jgi:trans-aconitate 2-methyltransferase
MTAPSAPWKPALYDASHSFVWKFGAQLLELLAVRPGERILDLGCGTGALTAQIADAGADVLGIDSSPEMIEQARHSFPGLDFEVADARSFKTEEPFDAVFSNAVLHWVKPPEESVSRIRAALKPGGRFVAEFGGRGNTARIVAALMHQASLFGVTEYEVPWYYPGIAEYTGILEPHGFEVTFANLFDRLTPLEGEAGLRNWFEMFGGSLLDRLSRENRVACLGALEAELRPSLYCDGTWLADYRRLRVVAVATA